MEDFNVVMTVSKTVPIPTSVSLKLNLVLFQRVLLVEGTCNVLVIGFAMGRWFLLELSGSPIWQELTTLYPKSSEHIAIDCFPLPGVVTFQSVPYKFQMT